MQSPQRRRFEWRDRVVLAAVPMAVASAVTDWAVFDTLFRVWGVLVALLLPSLYRRARDSYRAYRRAEAERLVRMTRERRERPTHGYLDQEVQERILPPSRGPEVLLEEPIPRFVGAVRVCGAIPLGRTLEDSGGCILRSDDVTAHPGAQAYCALTPYHEGPHSWQLADADNLLLDPGHDA